MCASYLDMYTHIRMYIYVYVCTRANAPLHTHTREYTHTHTCLHPHIQTDRRTDKQTYLYVYIHIYVHVCIYTHTYWLLAWALQEAGRVQLVLISGSAQGARKPCNRVTWAIRNLTFVTGSFFSQISFYTYTALKCRPSGFKYALEHKVGAPNPFNPKPSTLNRLISRRRKALSRQAMRDCSWITP